MIDTYYDNKVNTKTAARMLGVSPSTLRKWENLGYISSTRNKKTNYREFALVDIDNFLNKLNNGSFNDFQSASNSILNNKIHLRNQYYSNNYDLFDSSEYIKPENTNIQGLPQDTDYHNQVSPVSYDYDNTQNSKDLDLDPNNKKYVSFMKYFLLVSTIFTVLLLVIFTLINSKQSNKGSDITRNNTQEKAQITNDVTRGQYDTMENGSYDTVSNSDSNDNTDMSNSVKGEADTNIDDKTTTSLNPNNDKIQKYLNNLFTNINLYTGENKENAHDNYLDRNNYINDSLSNFKFLGIDKLLSLFKEVYFYEDVQFYKKANIYELIVNGPVKFNESIIADDLKILGEIEFDDDINFDDDIYVNDSVYSNKLYVGTDEGFKVDENGNITSINGVDYSWPTTQSALAGYVLVNNGSGVLSWEPGGTGSANWILSGTSLYPTNSNINVGIGNNSPSYKLDVTGSFRVSSDVYFTGTNVGTTNNVLILGPSNNVQYRDINPKVWTSLTLIDSLSTSVNYIPVMTDSDTVGDSAIYQLSGNIGIGTTNPTQKLYVEGGNIYVSNGNDVCIQGGNCLSTAGSGSGDITRVGSMESGDVFFDSNADDDWLGLGASAGRIEFDDQTIDEVNIVDAYLGIGTTTPSALLSVGPANEFTVTNSGAITGTTLNTGQGTYELYAMNQDVLTTSPVTFATIDTGQGAYEIQDASTVNKGLASFNSSNFSVTSGAVSIATGGVGSTELASSGVSANTYGGSTNIPVITVDEDGRITSASNQSISYENPLTIGNGLTRTGDTVDFGGSITADTRLYDGSYEYLYLDTTTGNIGIGTTGPTQRLDVNGNLQISGAFMPSGQAGTSGYYLQSQGAGNPPIWVDMGSTLLPSGTDGQTLRYNGTSWVANDFIYNNGTNVGIGNTAPQQALDVTGQILTSGGIRVGADSTNNLIDDASNGSGSTTLYIGNESILASGDIGVSVQGYNGGLQSISGLTESADQMLYTTASDTYALTTLTSFARTLLDDADNTGARTTLGLVIGTDVQGWDQGLEDVSGLTPADSTFIVGDGTNWVAETGNTARTSLGATTVGSNLFTLTNPSAITFLRINADNSVSALNDSDFRSAIGAGTVTNIATGTGLTGGAITTTGTISLSYSDTLASNSLSANNTVFGSTGIIFEGSSADANEVLLTVSNPGSDITYTLTGASGNVLTSANAATQLSTWDQDSSNDLTTSSSWTGGDLTGTGLAATIGSDKILESMLKAVNTATDEDILTYESTTGDFEWHTPGELGLQTSLTFSDGVSASGGVVKLGGANIDEARTITVATGGSLSIDMTATGAGEDFIIKDNGTQFALFDNTGYFQLDNIQLDANTISSTDTNGNLTLDPNGTGDVYFHGATYNLSDTGDLTMGGRITFENAEYIQNETDGILGITSPSTTFSGDITVSGDDLFMATNTSNYFLMADGTNYNPTSPADARTGLGLVSGGTGDIWVEKAGDTMTGNLTFNKADGSIIFDTVTATDTDFWLGVQDDAGTDDDDKFMIGDGTTPGTNPFLAIDTSGNVGIGTTGPTQKLDVNGNVILSATSPYLYFENTNNYLLSSSDNLISKIAGSYYFRDTNSYDRLSILSTGDTTINNASNGNIATFKNSGNVGIGTTSPTAKLTIQASSSAASLESELLITTEDRDFSSSSGNWSGTNWTIGSGVATHTAGANSFIHTLTPTATRTYQILATINTTTAGKIYAQFGAASGSSVGTTVGTLTQHSWVITATDTTSLRFIPDGAWAGTIDDVSVKEITQSSAIASLLDSNAYPFLEFRGLTSSGDSENIALGRNSIMSNITGIRNTSLGSRTLEYNTTGNSNVAIGYRTLRLNTTGSGNSAVGQYSLLYNTTGSNNSALGIGALSYNTTGSGNTASGLNALLQNTSGDFNVALGYTAMQLNTTGSNNAAVGLRALEKNTTGSMNVALGYWAGRFQADGATSLSNPENSVYIGAGSRGYDDNDDNSIVIGYNAIGLGANTVVLGNDSITTTALKGNVGVGTTAPAAKLQVAGTLLVQPTGNSTSSLTLAPGGTSNRSFLSIFATSDTTTNYTKLYTDQALGAHAFITTAGGTGTQYPISFNSTLTNPLLYINPNGNIGIGGTDAGATPKLFVDGSSGNVGIGTTGPTSILHTVASGAKTANYIGNLLTNTATSSTASVVKTGLSVTSTGTWNGTTAVNRGLYVNATGGTTNYSAIFEGGNVGIGTTAPSQNLDLIGSLELEDTTTSTTGVIFKGLDRFIHNYHNTVGGGAIPIGKNTFVGVEAGNFTMGSTATNSLHGSTNTAVGYQSLLANTIGYRNSSLGNNTLVSNTTGFQNSAFGFSSLFTNTEGYSNTAMGMESLYANLSGDENVAIGRSSSASNSTGDNNTTIGRSSLFYNSSGSNNIALGSLAGVYHADGTTQLTDPENSIYIGAQSRGYNNSDSNSIVIGYQAVGIGANSIVLGNDSITTTALKGNVGIGTTNLTSILHTVASGAKTADYIGNLLTNTATSSTASITKTGLSIESTGTWNGTTAVNRGLYVNATGGTTNYAAIFDGGNVGIGTTSPDYALQVNGVIAPETTDLDLGTASLRWDLFANTIDADSTVTLSGLSNDGVEATALLINGSNQVVYRELGSNAFTSTAYANTALSNLSSVAINTSLLPGTTDSIDLGSDSYRWQDLYLGGDTLHIGTSTTDEGTISYNTTNNDLIFTSTSDIEIRPTSGVTNFNYSGADNRGQFYNSAGTAYLAVGYWGSPRIESLSNALNINYNGDSEVTLFGGSASGENRYLNIGGYDTGASSVKYGRLNVTSDGTFAIESPSSEALSFKIGTTQYMHMNSNGRVGIGQTMASAGAKLGVSDDNSGYVATFFNDGNASTRSGISIQAGTDDGSGTNILVRFMDGDGTSIGDIRHTSGTITYESFTGSHLVTIPNEINNQGGYTFGTLMCVDSIVNNPDMSMQPEYFASACESPYDSRIIGIYGFKDDTKTNKHSIFAVGDGYALVTDQNGPITTGDMITSSNLKGYGMKSLNPGTIVGSATSDWDPSTQSIGQSTLPDGQIVRYGIVAVYYYPGTYYSGEFASSLSTEVVSLRNDVNNSTNRLLNTENSVTDINSQIASMQAEIDTLRQTLSELQGNTSTTSETNSQDSSLDTSSTDVQNTEAQTTDTQSTETQITDTSTAVTVDTTDSQQTQSTLTDESLTLTSDNLNSTYEIPQGWTLADYQETDDAGNTITVSKLSTDLETLFYKGVNIFGNLTAKSINATDSVSVGLITLNSLDNSINSIGDKLLIQSEYGAGDIDIFNGKIILANDGSLSIEGDILAQGNIKSQGSIEAQGDITAVQTVKGANIVANEKIEAGQDVEAQGKVVASKFEITNDGTNNQSAGQVTILAGELSVVVQTTALTPESLVFATPNKPVMFAANKVSDTEIEISLSQSQDEDIIMNWWIVGQKEKQISADGESVAGLPVE